ncbi:hypothetical protein PAESOLCIP111_03919 [Paenibacillus solanacearum]|uniref:Alpha-L-rhamnosidase n=1 Tax=Paenibacillus solanacearum TaxID=2048548 RepID=A0A916NR85_9BACL|nr:glycosylhydrolase-like jelly roll fold domain-containing protein [Paenibacillus solanacearum]CAG7638163.1 hypothetical protein PAESOLCIP111_03919 [Paenibacillus solanacearum]
MEQVAQHFANPPREFSPVPIWWWSGDELNLERLRWQMEKFVEGGVYNLLVFNLAPTGPLYGSDADRPHFFTEQWWDVFASVCEFADELGIRLWFYDQIGFSGANIQANLVRNESSYAGQSMETLTTLGEDSLTVRCPAEGELLAAVAVPVDDEGNAAGDPVEIAASGTEVTFSMPGRFRLRLIYAIRRGFDYFSAEACRSLLDQVHGEFERRASHWFRDVIVGSFQDELPNLPTWGSQFADQFRQRKGYDPRLMYLWEGDSAEARRMRIDYQQVRAELAEEAFFRPFFEWHERHGLTCGFDQMGPARGGNPVAAVKYYADYLRTHRWYGAPGSDHHGEAKIHSSLAHVYDKKRVWIESFHSSGWGGTLEETFDWLLPWIRAGANLYNPHAAYYSTRGGWYEWAPPSTCWRQPYWRHYSVFSGAVSRLCYLFTQGHHVCEIGILYPTTAVQANLTLSEPLPRAKAALQCYASLVGSMHWNNTSPGIMDGDRRDYDILNDDALELAEIRGGRLCIREEAYQAIILPACSLLREETAKMLCRFVEDGGTLIAIGEVPQPLDDRQDRHAARLAGLFAEGKAVFVETPEEVVSRLSGIRRTVDAPVPLLHRRIGDYDALFVQAAFPCATHVKPNMKWVEVSYSFTPDEYHRTMKVRLPESAKEVEHWDPITSKRIMLPVRRGSDGAEVEVSFASGPAAVLVWKRDALPESDSAPEQAASGPIAAMPSIAAQSVLLGDSKSEPLMSLGEEWECELVPTLDNRYGDFDKPDYEGAPATATWFMEHRVEQPGEDGLSGGWHEPSAARPGQVQATFGTFAWWCGPYAAAELPQPAAGRDAGLLDTSAAGWKPAVYSLSRGIAKNPIHVQTLGPKGHVPEEFLLFGKVSAGEGVHVRTGIWSDTVQNVNLAVGAPAIKKVWLNGSLLHADHPGYLSVVPVRLEEGLNVLDLQLFPEKDNSSLRAYWCLLRQPERFARPEWLKAPAGVVKDDRIVFSTTVDIPFPPEEGVIQVGADATCRLLVNGQLDGRQGGFDPYYKNSRIQPYAVSNFRMGTNEIAVEVHVPDYEPGLLVDAEVRGPENQVLTFFSGSHWQVQHAVPEAQPAALLRGSSGRSHNQDPPASHLWRRPHPLPGAAWLEDAPADDTVVSLVPDAFFGQQRTEWFGWIIPPGADCAYLPVAGTARLWIDGEEVAVKEGAAELPRPMAAKRRAVLRVVPGPGLTGGAVFRAPVTYRIAEGCILTGDWSEQGLESYSGGVRYRKQLRLDDSLPSSLVLDLGRVRGTAEVLVNGKSAGIRVMSPYRFDLSGLCVPGDNTIDIIVFNTLAPYLNAVSPTHYIFEGQTLSGMFGPVVLFAAES